MESLVHNPDMGFEEFMVMAIRETDHIGYILKDEKIHFNFDSSEFDKQIEHLNK